MSNPSFAESAALALFPLGGVVGGFVAQTLIAGRNVYINSITAERSKWLDKLRINLSAYYSLSASVAYRKRMLPSIKNKDLQTKQISDRYIDLEKLEERASLLRLQLNPGGLIDRNLLTIIEHLQAHQDSEGEEVSALRELLLSHAQWLLKAEWEKVKWEARGAIYRIRHKKDEAVKLVAYGDWVESRPKNVRFSHLLKAREPLLAQEPPTGITAS